MANPNPNPATQFKKGKSGNPGGRPKDVQFRWIVRKRLPVALRTTLRLPETATWASLIKLARIARCVELELKRFRRGNKT